MVGKTERRVEESMKKSQRKRSGRRSWVIITCCSESNIREMWVSKFIPDKR